MLAGEWVGAIFCPRGRKNGEKVFDLSVFCYSGSRRLLGNSRCRRFGLRSTPNRMGEYDFIDSANDLFGPREISIPVGCIPCGKEYDSYRIEWRIETDGDGKCMGFWCCPIEGCDGKGFGFDIFPTGPNYDDARFRWIEDDRADQDEINDKE